MEQHFLFNSIGLQNTPFPFMTCPQKLPESGSKKEWLNGTEFSCCSDFLGPLEQPWQVYPNFRNFIPQNTVPFQILAEISIIFGQRKSVLCFHTGVTYFIHFQYHKTQQESLKKCSTGHTVTMAE